MVLNNKEIIRAVINSEKRLNPTTETGSDFTFSFNKDISRITEIIVESIQIPYSFYAVNSTNNILTFNGGTVSIIIPPGNYTTSTLITTLKSLINMAFNDNSANVTFAYTTYKLTITKGISFSVDAAVDIPASTASRILGFHISTPNAMSATGNSVVNISGPNYLLLTSNLLTHAIRHPMLYVNGSYADVLVTVPVGASPGDIIDLRDKISASIKFSYKFTIKAGTAIDLKIMDELGNNLDMNGADVAIQLIFLTE